MTSNLIFKTKRLSLKPISTDEIDVIYPNVTDPEIAKYMSWEPHENMQQTRQFVERLESEMKAERTFTWSIYKDNTFCGIISLLAITRQHRSLTYNRAELAYWLDRSCQGKGIMTEACQRVVEFSFNEMKLHRLTVSHVSQNGESEALINRLNFRYIGEETESFKKNGKWYNHKLYELVNSNDDQN